MKVVCFPEAVSIIWSVEEVIHWYTLHTRVRLLTNTGTASNIKIRIWSNAIHLREEDPTLNKKRICLN
jgi:hypothetical protein